MAGICIEGWSITMSTTTEKLFADAVHVASVPPRTILIGAKSSCTTINVSADCVQHIFANLESMGGGQGLTYQTPSGLVTEGGTLLVGGNTGNNSVIGETGVDTAYNIGDGIGDGLSAVDTGVYNVITGTDSGGITASDVVNLINAGITVANVDTSTPTDANQYAIIPIPTDWTSPPPTGVAPFTPLTPINFGEQLPIIGSTVLVVVIDASHLKILCLFAFAIYPYCNG